MAAFIIGELSYADIGNAAVIESPNFPNLTAASLGAETFLGTGAVGYRFVDTGGYWIDGIAGFRYTWTKTDLSFNVAGGGVLSGGEDENWLDGFVGARGAVKLDSNGRSWDMATSGAADRTIRGRPMLASTTSSIPTRTCRRLSRLQG